MTEYDIELELEICGMMAEDLGIMLGSVREMGGAIEHADLIQSKKGKYQKALKKLELAIRKTAKIVLRPDLEPPSWDGRFDWLIEQLRKVARGKGADHENY